ncbi:hypothetical protein KUCAC02_027102 [Chaenocephalus aceratus]|uniref:Uncharacterized protein n=1 Tax=Chaenocephalus aceratus TaxID=36190 RepID=A0ACB9W2Z3_CHAAC|nr:hypothetical protein KUCAC02_027102 [Chaenocephalus aceratus]
MVYYLWRRKKKKKGRSQYEELLSSAPSVPACTAPVILVSKESWTRPSEIPFTLPPRFTSQNHADPKNEEEKEDEEEEMKMETQRPLAHRGSLSVRMWYPVGTVLAGLYSSPPLNEVVAPPPGMATRLCFSVEYRHSTEQLMVSLLRLANLPPRFHGNVSGVCVPQSTLSVCVLSVGQDGKRHAVGRVLFPLEGELAGAGRVLWRDLETEDDTQCSELGDVQISLSYSLSLQRLSVVVPRARGLQLLTDAGVCVQHLDEACLRFELQQPNPVRSEPPALLGVLVLGPFMYAKGPQLQHWMDMVNTPQEPVQLWHKLRRAT